MKNLPKSRKKKCIMCLKYKALDNFGNNHYGKSKRPYCTSCNTKRREEFNKKYPNRLKARLALRYAVRVGKIIKLPCNECGDKNVEGHHHRGYSKNNQLKVLWLCKAHHTQRHSSLKANPS